jgi:hypothetical protein
MVLGFGEVLLGQEDGTLRFKSKGGAGAKQRKKDNLYSGMWKGI